MFKFALSSTNITKTKIELPTSLGESTTSNHPQDIVFFNSGTSFTNILPIQETLLRCMKQTQEALKERLTITCIGAIAGIPCPQCLGPRGCNLITMISKRHILGSIAQYLGKAYTNQKQDINFKNTENEKINQRIPLHKGQLGQKSITQNLNTQTCKKWSFI